MKVVIDSNILISDFWLESIPSQLLLENSKKEKIDLYIPKVVYDETCNKFRERINSHSNNITKEINSLEKLSKEKTSVVISEKDREKFYKKYEKYLQSIIKQNKITILEYPDVPHEVIAKKAMLKKKPFNENEKGYRDALIWENVKSLISEEEIELPATPELIFITKNHKDFLDNNSLHSDLIEDLENQSLNTESIEIVESLAIFKDRFMNYYLNNSKAFKEKLEKNDFWDFELKQEVLDFLSEELTNKYLDNYHSFAPFANDDPTINYVGDEIEIKNIEVKKINSKQYLIDLTVNVDIEFDFYVDKSDYWSSNDTSFSIIDLNWNDHVIAASDTAKIEIDLSIIINNTLEVENIDIIKINGHYE